MNNKNNGKGSLAGLVILVIIILILYSIGKSGNSEDTCNYKGCSNPVYSYKGNLNGYCEKHRQAYDNWEAAEDLKKYIDSNQ